jgi:hypothetical protein
MGKKTLVDTINAKKIIIQFITLKKFLQTNQQKTHYFYKFR